METKICKCCKKEQNIENFRYSKGYFRGDCKKCEAKKHKEYCKTHKDIVKKIYHKTYIKNKEKYHENNLKRKKEMEIYNKEYYNKHKEYYKEYSHKYHLEHRNDITEYNKNWREKNKEKVNNYQKKDYYKRRRNPKLRLEGNLRSMINDAFRRRGMIKSKKLEDICCCSMNELINHLIKTYEENYSEIWNWNYIYDIHIDHKMPLATAKTEEDVIRLNHYTNLQLLKAQDNLKKGAKIL